MVITKLSQGELDHAISNGKKLIELSTKLSGNGSK
jgi:hypothetical protein